MSKIVCNFAVRLGKRAAGRKFNRLKKCIMATRMAIDVRATMSTTNHEELGFLESMLRRKSCEPMSAEEENACFADREASRERIMRSQMRLAFAIAKRYAKGEAIMDAFQNAMIGLNVAIDAFNPESGTRFVSFATHYIYGYMRNGAQHDVIVRSKKAAHLPKGTISEIETELTQKSLREVSVEELCEVVNERLGTDYEPSEIKPYSRCGLTTTADDGDEVETSDVVERTATRNEYEAEVERASHARAIERCFAVLTDKEKGVIEMKFLKDFDNAAIAYRLGVTEERVRQIVQGALQKMRKYGNAMRIAEAL